MKTKMTNLLYMTIVLLGLVSFSKTLGITELQAKIDSMEAKPMIQDPSQKITKTKAKTFDNSIDKEKDSATCSKLENKECDMITEGPICLFNGDRVLLPLAIPSGLIGYWNFDEIKPLDVSGNKNHAIGNTKPGPGFGGLGSSAFFSKGSFLQIPYTPSIQSSDFTITFWLFVIQDFFTASKGIRYCPLLQRGVDDLFSKSYQRSPALYYDRKEKNLHFYLKTSSEETPQGEVIISNSRVNAQRWLHIALQKMDSKIKLYVNGILDTSRILKSNLEVNNAPFYIGNVPWLQDQCDFPFLIDELRYYNIPIPESHIQAEASPVLGGMEPSFLQLGCMDCSLKDASQSCVDGYRLCTSIELHIGGYQIARSLGWLSWDTHLWTHGALKTPGDFDKLKGLALCCAELK